MAAAAIPIVTTIGGALLSKMAADDAADKQQSIIQNAEERSSKLADKNRQIGLEEARRYDPATRKKQQDIIEGEILSSNLSAIDGPGSTAENTNTGNVSSDYETGKAKAVAARTASGIDMAKLFAKMKAPNQLRLDESVRGGDMNSMMSQNANSAANYSRAGATDASTVKPNGLLQLLGTVASAYGASKAGQLNKVPGSITGTNQSAGGVFGSGPSAGGMVFS